MTARGHATGGRLSIAVRLRPALFERIVAAAGASGRTVSGEIAWRIECSIRDEDTTRARLAGPSAAKE